jgi:predicted ArsR family transcriptional regulator
LDEQTTLEAPRTTQDESLRDRLLAYLKEQIGGEGKHAIMRTKNIAAHFSVTPVTISKYLRSLVESGHIRTKPAGPKGTIITLEAEPKRRGRPRAVAAAGDAGARTLARRTAPGGAYCPWCGTKVQKAWRYCNRCGHGLPH